MPAAESDKQAKEDPTLAGRFGTSVDHLRSTAKWAIAAYAAVGAILVAGSQLSSIGAFTWDDRRLWIAIAAMVVALASVALAVHTIVTVQTVGEVTLPELAGFEQDVDDRRLYTATVVGDYRCATETSGDIATRRALVQLCQVRRRLEAEDHIREHPAVDPVAQRAPTLLNGYPTVRELAKHYQALLDRRYHYSRIEPDEAELAQTIAWIDFLNPVVNQLLAAARYERVQSTFATDARRKLLWSSLLAAVAIGVFAWAANPQEAAPGNPPAFAMPAQATLVLSPERQSQLASVLGGAECVAASLPVLVLSATDQTADVVTPPREGCEPERLTVSRTEVVPAERVALPPTAATPDPAASG